MKGRTNMTGVEEGGAAIKVLPQGEYVVEVVEAKDGLTKNDDPMISLKLVVDRGEFKGQWLWDNIIIPNEGSPAEKIKGRSKHFLHCIGEEYEGEFNWDNSRWVGKKVTVEVDHEPANDYHKYTKPIVAKYILDEDLINGNDDFLTESSEESPL